MNPLQSQPDNSFFIKAVAELGDTRKIVAIRDIYSESGIKLVATGIQITSGLLDRLLNHTLLPSMELAVTMEHTLNNELILDDLRELAAKNDRLKVMMDKINTVNAYQRVFLGIDIPHQLAFKLTVAREKFRSIYDHSLLLAVLSIYLASCDGMNEHEEEWVAMAALFHDIGLLHIDPILLESSHKMTNDERRHLYAHPLTAYLLLHEFPQLNKHIAEAVLEHHERMDGRGYPRGLMGTKISRYGQILAVAELAAKAFDPGQTTGQWKKLEVMLKLNFKQYGPGLIGHLNILNDHSLQHDESANQDIGELIAKVKLIAIMFADLDHYANSAINDKIIDFANKRLVALRMDLLSAGFDPREPDSLIQMITDDPECINDFAPLLDEAIWQFKSLIQEAERLWPKEIGNSESQSQLSTGYSWLNDLNLKLLAIPALV